jgi:hypothetical protein
MNFEELTHLGDAELLSPGEVAQLYRSDPKTVTRWANSGWIPDDPDTGMTGVVRTPGGHTRLRASVIRKLLSGELTMTRDRSAARAEPDEPPASTTVDHPFVPHADPGNPGGYRCGYATSTTDASTFCWRTLAEHQGHGSYAPSPAQRREAERLKAASVSALSGRRA